MHFNETTFRQRYQEWYQKWYRPKYKQNLPKSAISQYYQFWLSLEGMTANELQALFTKRKRDCKYASPEKIKQLRTEMAIINDCYQELKQQEIDNQFLNDEKKVYDEYGEYIVIDEYNDQEDY